MQNGRKKKNNNPNQAAAAKVPKFSSMQVLSQKKSFSWYMLFKLRKLQKNRPKQLQYQQPSNKKKQGTSTETPLPAYKTESWNVIIYNSTGMTKGM